jgi:2-phospho-L-lactate guanylyltransferase (CobY/MobA/RfbA family)
LDEIQQWGVPSALVIPADIPLVRSSDLELLLEYAERYVASPGFGLLIPSRDHDGTNALFFSPPDLISPRFGKNSFSRHVGSLADRRVPYRVIENENIGLDIDSADDLQTLLSREIEGETREKLFGFQWVRSQLNALNG